MLYTGDFVLRYYVRFSQIRSHITGNFEGKFFDNISKHSLPNMDTKIKMKTYLLVWLDQSSGQTLPGQRKSVGH